MTKLKTAAQVCEVILLLAGIALLSGTDGLRGESAHKNSADKRRDPDDFSAWGIGA